MPDASATQTRRLAAKLVYRVASRGESASQLLSGGQTGLVDPRERAFVQELVLGTLRWYHQLAGILELLLQKPLKARDADLHALLLTGLYQLRLAHTPAHAAVSETVEAARLMGKKWAAGLVNAVLRNASRRESEIDRWVARHGDLSYPHWWMQQIRYDWPQHHEQILQAGMQRPPMSLRVNALRGDRDQLMSRLQQAGIAAKTLDSASQAIQLDRPMPVEQLPGFAEGLVSVQDAAAQLCAPLLAPRPGDHVLDACAAPGGKTCHLLELQPGIGSLLAIDHDAGRLERVRQNLDRLGLQAQVQLADASQPAQWWDGRQFDRILLDAPCSASGVVRRHPDIKLLRREDDLPRLAAQQQTMLRAMWPLLAPGGILLYVTCSVFRCENTDNASAFLQRQADAHEDRILDLPGLVQAVGWQVLPGIQGMDGFYFARFRKAADQTAGL